MLCGYLNLTKGLVAFECDQLCLLVSENSYVSSAIPSKSTRAVSTHGKWYTRQNRTRCDEE